MANIQKWRRKLGKSILLLAPMSAISFVTNALLEQLKAKYKVCVVDSFADSMTLRWTEKR